MNIVVVGTGYVGLSTGVCLAEMGHKVCCMDIDQDKIAGLNDGQVPFYEPDLADLLTRNKSAGQISFTTKLDEVINDCDICFVAVGTPMGPEGAADLSQVIEVAKVIGSSLSSDLVIILKSTVPVGTTVLFREKVQIELKSRRAPGINVDVLFNPEFLREGAAVEDFFNSNRIIIGADGEKGVSAARQVYGQLIEKGVPFLVMDMGSAELAKYAANTMLACRISLMNELARVCDAYGADIKEVQYGMACDPRIGDAFLNAGIGYGGSCFPKDINELLYSGQRQGIPMHLTRAIDGVNREQSQYFVSLITRRFGSNLSGLTFGVWGLTFKPDSDDMREAVSLYVLPSLLERGAHIRAFDPLAPDMGKYFARFDQRFTRVGDMYEATRDADSLILITEWQDFSAPDFDHLASVLRQPVVFDGRNQYDPTLLYNKGLEYYCIGRSCIPGKEVD